MRSQLTKLFKIRRQRQTKLCSPICFGNVAERKDSSLIVLLSQVSRMTEESHSQFDAEAFVIACGRVLGLTPIHAYFQTYVDKDGRSRIGWNSFIRGMGGQLMLSRYRELFGEFPQWVNECHPHHQHYLADLAIAWHFCLPSVQPHAIAPARGEDKFVHAMERPPAVRAAAIVVAPWTWALPQLSENAAFADVLTTEFDSERAASMLSMMRAATLHGSDGDSLMDFILDGISNDNVTVWTANTLSAGYNGTDDVWPISIQEYFGLFRVSSPEYDPAGPFPTLEAAKQFVYSNWDYVENGRYIAT